MFKDTQFQWVKDNLFKKGTVSRNAALDRRLSRLSAYIENLNKAGFKITGEYVKTKNGRDYLYTLIK